MIEKMDMVCNPSFINVGSVLQDTEEWRQHRGIVYVEKQCNLLYIVTSMIQNGLIVFEKVLHM